MQNFCLNTLIFQQSGWLFLIFISSLIKTHPCRPCKRRGNIHKNTQLERKVLQDPKIDGDNTPNDRRGNVLSDRTLKSSNCFFHCYTFSYFRSLKLIYKDLSVRVFFQLSVAWFNRTNKLVKLNDEVNLLQSKSTVTMLNDTFSLYHDVVCFAFTPNDTENVKIMNQKDQTQ